jgi:hypothetical protein
MNIFKSFNDFLNHCVDYVDNRILTGKFIGDIAYQILRFIKFITSVIKQIYTFLNRSKTFSAFITYLIELWNILLKVPIFNMTVQMITDILTIVIACYSEIFIVFTLTFTSSVVLLNWFQSSIILFFIALIPIILLNNFFASALYYSIRDREINGKISFWQDVKTIASRFGSICSPIVIELALILESFIAYFLILFFVSGIYNYFKITWSGSFFFWFVVIFLSNIIVIGLFILTLIMQQAYFSMLFNGLSLKKAINQNILQIRKAIPYYLFYNIIFYLISADLIWHAVLSSLYIGFTLGLYSAISLGMFLAFLLHRQFANEEAEQISTIQTNKKSHIVMIIIVAGFINYLLIASLFIKEYEPILSFIQMQQDNFLAQQEMKLYVNKLHNYSLEYPGNWTLYQWNSDSVTFYNNYTGTLTGGTWMNINISPYNENYFEHLYYAAPGITDYNAQSGDVTTKVTDTTLQNFQTVNYTYIKRGLPYKQYETHYLIHKDGFLYDIAFVSLTNDVASYNSDLFQKIINSFIFIN